MTTNAIPSQPSEPSRPAPRPLCAVFAPLLPLLAAGELDAEQEVAVRTHTAGCDWCSAKLATFGVVESALRRHYGDYGDYGGIEDTAGSAFRPFALADIVRLADEGDENVDDDEDDAALPTVSSLPRQTRLAARPRGRPSRLAAVAAVLLVAVLAGTIFTLRAVAPALVPHPRSPVELAVFPNDQSAPACTTSSPGLPLYCPDTHFVCPRDAAWSPNDARVALVSSCANVPQNDARVFVYDAQTGKRLLDLNVLSALQKLPNMPVPRHNTTLCTTRFPDAQPFVMSSTLLWSRDGAQLVIPFYLNYATQDVAPGICYGWLGLLLVRPDGSSPQALFHAYGDDTTTATAPANYNCSSVWDLETGTLVPTPVDTSPAGEAFGCLAPALSYAWGANGTLTPTVPLPAANSSATSSCPAPGTPNGDARMSIWQAGAIWRLAPPQPYQNTPPIYIWETYAFAGMSPDGRYVVANPPLTGLVDPAGQALPGSAAVAASGLGAPARLPVPGQVMEQRLAELPASYFATQEIAFRPDGHVVATDGVDAFATNSGQVQHVSKPVALYDCASGRKIVTLTPITDTAYAGRNVSSAVSSTLLRWSPDGKYLLYADNTYGAATLWGPDQLPH